jgi:alpha amylase catalytic region
MIKREAIFSDETNGYVNPPEPGAYDNISICIRVAKDDVDRVEILHGKNYSETTLLRKYHSDYYFDYYKLFTDISNVVFRYVFRISKGKETVYYDRVGVSDGIRVFQGFEIIPDFKTPDWAKGAIMYQIFVDRFCRGDGSNDVLDDEYIYLGVPCIRTTNWSQYPSNFDVGYFYGGDLQGVMDKLDYLKSLGVEAIYFNPIFVSPSNHKYDAQDYEHIDPHYAKIVNDGGELVDPEAEDNLKATKYIIRTTDKENLEASDRFFANFVDIAHQKGIKIILDGVFNHCGSFHKWLDKESIYKNAKGYPRGAFHGVDSPYRSYFRFHEDTDSYDGWWGHSTLPKLFYENSDKLVNEILAIARKWISPPYNVDGWRLDVAADLGHSEEFNHRFWTKFRKEVKKINPDVIILAEHYGDPYMWLNGKQWDTVMNYDAFMEPVSFFLTGMEKHSEAFYAEKRGDGKLFWHTLLYAKARMPMPSYMCSMNELSNHDHSRFLTRTNMKVGRLHTVGSKAANEGVDVSIFRQAVIMQMTLQGAPTIYYGDEVGVCGWTDPDNRRSFPWGKEDWNILEFHKYAIGLHKRHKSLRYGSLIPILGEKDLIAYIRAVKDEQMLVVIYTGNEEIEVDIPVWLMGLKNKDSLVRVMLTEETSYNVGEYAIEVKGISAKLKLKKNTAAMYLAKSV